MTIFMIFPGDWNNGRIDTPSVVRVSRAELPWTYEVTKYATFATPRAAQKSSSTRRCFFKSGLCAALETPQ
jgi:hypothetical protein